MRSDAGISFAMGGSFSKYSVILSVNTFVDEHIHFMKSKNQLVLQRKVDNEKTEWFVNRRHGIFLQSPSQ